MRRISILCALAFLGVLITSSCGRRRVVVVSAGAVVAPAQTFGGPPNFGYLNLPSGFLPDPMAAAGQAGGNLPANQLGAGCLGNISATPDHVVQTATGFQFFRIFVRSGVDTTLVVRDPSGQVFCNDDGGQGLNPMVQNTYWMPGNYEIWVGTYNAGDYGAPHQIYFTEIAGMM